MAATVELDIAGLEGNMMAQPRVFAHDAQPLNVADFGDLLVPLPTVDETVFMQRGACLYVGVDVEELKVVMESGSEPIFKNVPAGSFLPILVTKVEHAYISTAPANVDVADGDIIALW